MKSPKNQDLLSQQLKSIWVIESILVESMPDMIGKAQHLGLKKTLAFHFAETQQHKVAIEAICKQLEIFAKLGGFDEDINSILNDAEEKMNRDQLNGLVDLAIVSSAIEIEKYEITVYEQTAKLAKELGLEGVAKRLFLTFEEERQSLTKLRFLENQLANRSAEIGQHSLQ